MKLKTSFNVELAQEGEGLVVFKFKAPKLNDLYKDQAALKKINSTDTGVVSEGQFELINAIISRCVSVTGLIDDEGNELGAEAIGEFPISILGALIAAYHKGSTEAIGGEKKATPALTESESV